MFLQACAACGRPMPTNGLQDILKYHEICRNELRCLRIASAMQASVQVVFSVGIIKKMKAQTCARPLHVLSIMTIILSTAKSQNKERTPVRGQQPGSVSTADKRKQ